MNFTKTEEGGVKGGARGKVEGGGGACETKRRDGTMKRLALRVHQRDRLLSTLFSAANALVQELIARFATSTLFTVFSRQVSSKYAPERVFCM